jgi:hypothetical protein
MAVGLLCLILSWFIDGTAHHTRFWSNFLHNSVFFTGIAFMAVFFYSVCNTAWAGWHIQFKRVWESMSMFLGVGLILMAIVAIGLILGWHHLYHWADHASVEEDAILKHKSSFLNVPWYIISIIVIAVWYFFARKLRTISIAEDNQGDTSFDNHIKSRYWTAGFLPVAGFTSCLVIWQWVMSVDAHWYSTLFAWYSGASLFVSMIALTILILLYMQSKGYFPALSKDHFHDLGKFLFAFSIFWTYLWFSQYMLIWYSNNGEETVYFNTRQDNYPVLFYGNLVINFLVPFFILMRNDTKRKVGSLVVTAMIVFFGHWMDFFLMIKPGVLHTIHELGGHDAHGVSGDHGQGAVDASLIADHTAEAAHEGAAHVAGAIEAGFALPGLIEIGTMIGFLSLFLFVFYNSLTKANLIAKNDPYLSESLHHHV